MALCYEGLGGFELSLGSLLVVLVGHTVYASIVAALYLLGRLYVRNPIIPVLLVVLYSCWDYLTWHIPAIQASGMYIGWSVALELSGMFTLPHMLLFVQQGALLILLLSLLLMRMRSRGLEELFLGSHRDTP